MKNLKFLLILFFLMSATSGFGANNYLENTNVINPDAVSMPAKGGTHTDTTTGATFTRRSNISEMGAAAHGMIVYSRYSPSNSNGQYLLVHGTNSTSCYVYRLSDNVMVADLKRDATHQIGELNEIRWDYTGAYPNRVYFVYGMSFYYMDVIVGNGAPTLIRNFSSDFPNGFKIINDVEGDSSSDSRYWAWQVLSPYTGQYYLRQNIFTYDKQTNAILGTLSIGDIVPTQNQSNWTTTMPFPNMVEISPDGTKVITHYARSYAGGPTADFPGTYFDGPHAWNLDFSGTPVRISASETHSGWGHLADGTQVFISQDNTTDKLQYCRTDGVGGPWPGNCEYFMDHASYGYFGVHFAKMPASKPGWALVSTSMWYWPNWTANNAYANNSYLVANGYIYRATTGGTSGASSPSWPTTIGQTVNDNGIVWQNWGHQWASNQLLMVELKPMAQSPRIWRVAPQYNISIDYRSEGSAAISQDGEKVYVTNNWMDVVAGHGEAYEIDISGWAGHYGMENLPTSAGATITTGGAGTIRAGGGATLMRVQ